MLQIGWQYGADVRHASPRHPEVTQALNAHRTQNLKLSGLDVILYQAVGIF